MFLSRCADTRRRLPPGAIHGRRANTPARLHCKTSRKCRNSHMDHPKRDRVFDSSQRCRFNAYGEEVRLCVLFSCHPKLDIQSHNHAHLSSRRRSVNMRWSSTARQPNYFRIRHCGGRKVFDKFCKGVGATFGIRGSKTTSAAIPNPYLTYFIQTKILANIP